MSEKKDQEYLGDGMAEEIINLLAQVPDLLVPARTSSFYFKGKQTKVPDIARELGVTNVLEGSIRRSGDRLRVTVQLVRADNGYHLWSETYNRELRDVFELQDDIANAVVQALRIKLMGGELNRRKGGPQLCGIRAVPACRECDVPEHSVVLGGCKPIRGPGDQPGPELRHRLVVAGGDRRRADGQWLLGRSRWL